MDREYGLYDPNRHTMKRVVEWDENGMPVFQ
ncbi:unknown [Firmicutes bacterium CAG:791]|nr:unknown [Firmicutes bacterium CAG:791]